jgi:hypothetical protein
MKKIVIQEDQTVDGSVMIKLIMKETVKWNGLYNEGVITEQT